MLTGNKEVDGALGVLPDLRASGGIVNLWVGCALELLQHEGVWRSRLYLLCFLDGTSHSLRKSKHRMWAHVSCQF